ncbi:sulfite exporter TauE/SafE family protein [Anaerophaga thermohalophila]|uniref:sulfite exporter TauE/SafE family protein n=1 Tax=Anaerophaga thermohalophila TaxID=177400 RepID=UPI000237CE59|nr:sulfite exporter TauE/SafE family protein [Anaerophaga thermohalophila]
MGELTVLLIVVSGVVILMSSLLKGMTGFGFALLAIPFLSLIYPVKVLVPAMTIFNLITSVILLLKIRERISWYYFIPMFVASLGGIPLGIYLLDYLDEEVLRIIIGVTLIFLSLKMLSGIPLARRFRDKPVFFAGFLSGILSGSVSLGGPPLVIAMSRKNYNKDLFRGIFAWFSVFSSFFALAGFYAKGMIPGDSLRLSLYYTPLLFLGSSLGNKLAALVNAEKFKRVIVVVNVFTGVITVISAIISL